MAPLRKRSDWPALPLTPSSVVRSRSCEQFYRLRRRAYSESGSITVGQQLFHLDTATIRGLKRNPMRIGDNVLVGPRAYLTGCEVEDNAFLATGATVI